MSYDFSVYAVAPLAFDELVRLVRSTAGFDVEGEPSSDADSLVVVRGARRAYCFTIDGPFDVEAEDVPEEVTASVIGAKAVYQVLVEGSEEMSIPHAVKFARKLAKATNGALFDEQTEEVWPKPKGKRTVAPSGERVTDCVDMVFYFLKRDAPNDLPEIYLRLARAFLPEALPRRFGTYSPLTGNLQRDGDQGFVDACKEPSMFSLEIAGSYPVARGSYSRDPEYSVRDVVLSFDRAVLSDPKWRDVLQSFFIAFATESRSFFASVEVLRDHILSRGTFYSSGKSEQGTYGAFRGTWMGLQPYPHWWVWMGPDYADLLSPYLLGRREKHGDYLFHTWSEEPLNRDQLEDLLPDPSIPWIPVDLQASRGPDKLVDQPAKIIPVLVSAPNPR